MGRCNQILSELIQGYLLLFLVAILAAVRGGVETADHAGSMPGAFGVPVACAPPGGEWPPLVFASLFRGTRPG